MTDEDEQKFRAMMTDVVGGAIGSLEKRFDQWLLELEAEIALLNDRFDSLEIILTDARAHSVKVSREQMREKLRRERLEKRIEALEPKGAT